MFYWIISAALIASAVASPLPCNWITLCTPYMIYNANNNIIPPKVMVPETPIPVNPQDDGDHPKTETPPTNIDTSFETAMYEIFKGVFSNDLTGAVAPTPAPTTTTTTTTSTTTEAPANKVHKNGITVESYNMGQYTDSFGKKQKTPGGIAGNGIPDFETWKNFLSVNPEFKSKMIALYNSVMQKNFVSLPRPVPDVEKEPKKPEPCDDETKKTVPELKIPTPAPEPVTTTTTTPAPEQSSSTSSTVITTFSGPNIVGHSIKQESSKSEKSSSSIYTQYFGNDHNGYTINSDKKVFKMPSTSSSGFKQTTTKVEKLPPTFMKNPCELFTTGIFRNFPCDNLLNRKTVVGTTIPINSFETYSFNTPFGFLETNNDLEENKPVDC